LKKVLIIAVAIIVLGGIIFLSVRGGDEGEKVYAAPVKAQKLESVVSAPGEINPRVKVNVSAHIVGKIEHLYMQEGDRVKRGQKLVDLERPAYQAQHDRAVAELVNRRIEVQRSKLALENSELEYKRATSLQQQGISAQQLFDKARLDKDNARAGYDSAIQGVHQAEALLQQAETDLQHTTIVSPIDGKVVQLNAHEGEVVVTGTMNNPASVIAVVADLSEILVEADVGETEVVGIKLNLPAKVKVDAVPDREYAGHVAEIGSSAAVRAGSGSGQRYFKVKVAIDNPDDRLRPGMTAQVSIITSTSADAPVVPIQSVVDRIPPALAKTATDENTPKKKYVFIIHEGVAKMTEVTTGISDATNIAIASGVKVGDQIVTGPFRTLKKLKDGAKVQVTKEETKKAGEE